MAVYCGLVGLLMWRGTHIFGQINTAWGPILFVTLFAASALICALLTLGYPIILFLDKKNTKEAVHLVGFTAGWLVLFVLGIIVILTVT